MVPMKPCKRHDTQGFVDGLVDGSGANSLLVMVNIDSVCPYNIPVYDTQGTQLGTADVVLLDDPPHHHIWGCLIWTAGGRGAGNPIVMIDTPRPGTPMPNIGTLVEKTEAA